MSTAIDETTANSKVSKTEHFERTITVEPGHLKSIGLGAYRTAEPAPEFDLSFSSDMSDVVDAVLERLELDRSRYLLLYQLHNYGKQSCTVTVRRQGM